MTTLVYVALLLFAQSPDAAGANAADPSTAAAEEYVEPLVEPPADLTDVSAVKQYLLDLVDAYGPGLIKAALVVFFGLILSRILTGVVRKVMKRAKVEATLTGFIGNLVFAALATLVVVSALQTAGVQTTSFVAVIGAAGLAIGFALQGTLSNFAAGVLLILFRPFKAGDYIEGGGVSGTVEELQVFATILRTPDNKKIIVPNSAVSGGNITNYSANPTRRVDMVFGIGYGDDIKKAKQVLEKILSEDSRILSDPKPQIALSELGDSSVNFIVRPWVKTPDYWDVKFETTEKVKERFDAEGISIPFPQRDVHVFNAA